MRADRTLTAYRRGRVQEGLRWVVRGRPPVRPSNGVYRKSFRLKLVKAGREAFRTYRFVDLAILADPSTAGVSAPVVVRVRR